MRETKGSPDPVLLLHQALVEVESLGMELVEALQNLNTWRDANPPPRGFSYFAPPRVGASESKREAVQARRRDALAPRHLTVPRQNRAFSLKVPKQDTHVLPSRNKPWYDRFDTYHRDLMGLQRAIDNARRALIAARSTLDSDGTPPLDRASNRLLQDLNKIASAVPSPRVVGDIPPSRAAVPEQLDRRLRSLATWIERVQAAAVLTSSAPPARAASSARARPRTGRKQDSKLIDPIPPAGQSPNSTAPEERPVPPIEEDKKRGGTPRVPMAGDGQVIGQGGAAKGPGGRRGSDRGRRARAPAPVGWIYLDDAMEKYELKRTTAHHYAGKLPATDSVLDDDSKQRRVREEALRGLLTRMGRLEQ